MGLDQLYTGRAGGSARVKGFNSIISAPFTVCPLWPDGKGVGRRVEGPEFDSGRNPFVFAYFPFFLFFSLSFLFSYCSFVLFCFFI